MLKALVVSFFILCHFQVFAADFYRKPYALEYLRFSCPVGLGFGGILSQSEIYFSRLDRNFVLSATVSRDRLQGYGRQKIIGKIQSVHSTELFTELNLFRNSDSASLYVIRIMDGGRNPALGDQHLRVIYGQYELTPSMDHNFKIAADLECVVESI